MGKPWWEKKQYPYYKLPKFLLEDEKYLALSDGAKLLFSLILDRMGLSAKNGLMENETVYVLYTNREICHTLHWSHDKATRRLEELELAGLITREKTKLGRPDRISVCTVLVSRSEETIPRNAKNEEHVVREIRTTECGEFAPIKNDSIKTDSTNINLSINGSDADAMECEIKEQIEYDILVEDGFDQPLLDTLVRVMADTCTGTSSEVRVAGKSLPRQQVCERLRSLNMFHIQYVLDCLKKSTTAIRNINAYLLTALYKAPETMDSYYHLEVQHDFAGTRPGPRYPLRERAQEPMPPGWRGGDDLPY